MLIEWISRLNKATLKGAYTVEATLVMGICLMVITGCIMLGFSLYKDTLTYMDKTVVSDLDAVDAFRKIQAVKNAAGSLGIGQGR